METFNDELNLPHTFEYEDSHNPLAEIDNFVLKPPKNKVMKIWVVVKST